MILLNIKIFYNKKGFVTSWPYKSVFYLLITMKWAGLHWLSRAPVLKRHIMIVCHSTQYVVGNLISNYLKQQDVK